MSDLKNKYILVDNELIGGRVIFHRQLHRSGQNKPKGGGWWYFHEKQNKLILYGGSFDFGNLTVEQVENAELGGCFTNMENVEIIFDSRDHLEVMNILSEHLGQDEGIRCALECDYI